MAVLFLEGFDKYVATTSSTDHQALFEQYYDRVVNDRDLHIETGDEGLVFYPETDKNATSVSKQLPVAPTTGKVIIGWRSDFGGGKRGFVCWSDDSTWSPLDGPSSIYSDTNQVRHGWNSTGSSYQSVGFLSGGTYRNWEAILDLDNDTIEVYYDGTLLGDATCDFSLFPVTHIRFGGYDTGPARFSHVYVLDDTGSHSNNTLGSTARIGLIQPSGDTAASGWNINGGASGGFDAVSGVPYNNNTSISTTASGQTSVFNWQENSVSGITQVHGIQVAGRWQQPNTGISGVQFVQNASSPTVLGSIAPSGTSAVGHIVAVSDNPETGSQYTLSQLNNIELGVRSV